MNLSEECATGKKLFHESCLCYALQISFTILFTISVVYLIIVKRKCRSLFHQNFSILLLNAIGVSLASSYGSAILFANYFISKWTTNDDEQCSPYLPQFGLVLFTKMTVYFYFLALPLFHFGIMCERVRATLRAKTYEKEARKFGFIMLGIIWTILCAYSIFIALTALIDKKWNLQLQIVFPNLALSAEANNAFIFNLHFALCIIIFSTTLVEFWIIWHNFRERKRQKKGSFSSYSLSHKFQVNENIVSMQLMLPLDICYFFIFLIHIGLSIWLMKKLDITAKYDDYASIQLTYDWIGMSYNIYGNVSVWLYIQFLKRNSKSMMVKIRQNQVAAENELKAKNEMQLYFNQLKNQWA